MNHASLVKHYKILKDMKAISTAIHSSTNTSCLNYRERWDLHENEHSTYSLFYTGTGSNLQLIRTDKDRNAGYTIARLTIRKNLNNRQENYVYRKGCGFAFHGTGTSIKCSDSQEVGTLLESLPPETVSALLSDSGYEELEFQYGTLHNFTGLSFEMYCIFSLLVNVDAIQDEIGNDQEFCHLSFLTVIEDEVSLEAVQTGLNVLSTKIIKDLKELEDA